MIRAFFTTDPLVAALLLTGGSVCLCLLVRAWYRAWVRQEEAKARLKFSRIASAMSESQEPVNYPPKSAGQHATPWRNRRVS